jgi:23S rRNA pseudouridine1911/1915/1917 synthase
MAVRRGDDVQRAADYRNRTSAEPPPEPGADLAAADEPEAEEGAVEDRAALVDASGHHQRLDKVLAALAPEFSRSHLQQLVRRGLVRIDGSVVQHSARRLRAGERIEVRLEPTAQSRAFRPEALPLEVLFEDEHLLVIDKPAGLVVHPAPGNWSGTLLNALLARHAGAAELPRAGIVHRLDKDTSGVMVVGKSLEAVTVLVRDIAARRVQRRYLALAHQPRAGPVAAGEAFVIEAPIGRDPRSRVRMAIVGSGRSARTDVHCVAASGSVAALSCTLHTGRTHQIRVHLAHRGMPLVADALYGGAPALGLQRQALHAVQLGLAHPLARAPLAFTCAPPRDFAQAWSRVAGATMIFD